MNEVRSGDRIEVVVEPVWSPDFGNDYKIMIAALIGCGAVCEIDREEKYLDLMHESEE
jgi:hypothetical protein